MPNAKHQQFNWSGIELLVDETTHTGPANLAVFTVATVPAAASFTGGLIYVSNGAAGSPVVAFSNGTNWLRVDTLAAIAAA
jgi:hypothetical protein